MGGRGLDIQVDAGHRGDLAEVVDQGVRAALLHEGVSEAEISVALLDDETIRRLNREYLSHDYATDVISFALWEEGQTVLGDVYIGVDQAGRQADDHGVSVWEEVTRLAVHGTLHVLGYDHPDEPEARAESEMYKIQESILAGLAGAG